MIFITAAISSMGRSDTSGPISFLMDAMLKGAGRYLRFLGFDVLIVERFEQALSEPSAEQRVFLTTSRKHLLQWPYPRKALIQSSQTEDQVQEVLSAFSLYPHIQFLSRCSLCNQPIEPVDREAVREKVPDKVWQTINEFYRCPSCQKIYWEGGHVVRLKDKFSRMGIPID